VLTALVLAADPWLKLMGVHPSVARLAVPYIRATAWSVAPLLVYAACRRYLQSTGRVGAVVFALVSANVINALANWVLIFGHLGFRAWGVAGSGWATTIARLYMALVVATAATRPDRGRTAPPGTWRRAARLDLARIRRLLRLGFPAALHTTLEVGVFAMATTLAGRLDPSALAAHQIVLSVATVTFMIPLGLSSAAAVRVGQALGRGDARGAARAGWTAIALGAGFMSGSALTFLAVPATILSGFTIDPAVIAVGLSLLHVAAAFQVFDGLQGVTTGALRGAGDTHTPMTVNLLAHWTLGLPCGYLLAFPGGLGALGLWLGLSLGLIVAGIVLVRTWSVKVHHLEQAVPLHAGLQPEEPGPHVAAEERRDQPFQYGA
jgi:MATE family multidrug resistance protein